MTELEGHDHDDGIMEEHCEQCAFIATHPCRWCGFGALFTTHNPLAHCENGDPVAARLHDITGDGENAWYERFNVYLPYTEGSLAVEAP